MVAVTLEVVSCQVEGKNEGSGHARARIMPGGEENVRRRSRWRSYPARLKGKVAEVVTMEVASCPVERKMGGSGHVGACILPSGKEKLKRWSRKRLHRAQLKAKWIKSI